MKKHSNALSRWLVDYIAYVQIVITIAAYLLSNIAIDDTVIQVLIALLTEVFLMTLFIKLKFDEIHNTAAGLKVVFSSEVKHNELLARAKKEIYICGLRSCSHRVQQLIKNDILTS